MVIHSQRPGSGVDTRSRRMLRVVLPVLATVAIVIPLAWMWQASRMPTAYSVMEMGYLDYGGHGQDSGHSHHSEPARSVTELVAEPARPADVRVDLVTRQEILNIAGRSITGFTVNGTSPGPEIRVRQGQLIEVHLRNESVVAGVALHWHGLDVPNAMDGVAGVTQDAVPIGAEFTYRFVADRAGSFWYHSHQVSNPQGCRRAAGFAGSAAAFGHRRAGRRCCACPHLRGCEDHQRQGRRPPRPGGTRSAHADTDHQH
jgi:FtsP/CotA-like multicopper oxidase with cupredoxin domain